jgi:hypothetical protein
MTEGACELLRRQPEMHEVAEAPSVTFSVFVLPTACFTEIRDWGEFCVQWSTSIPPVVQILDCGLRFRFPFKTGINVSDEVIANVITHLSRAVSAMVERQCNIKDYARAVQEDVQTVSTRSTSPHKPHQTPPEVLWGSNGRPDREPGYGKR